ncbi:hypothetical protein B0H14DRAFT_2830695 [Mycena olivaceomarginata]|nr:hypothetical protein B0H14DRAFT_2830695 [Mycena olivaceomarginata]
MNKRCGGKLDPKSDEEPCGGHAIQRKFRAGKVKGKYTFIGCANWSHEDGIHHSFIAIPERVGENIMSALFDGDPIYMDGDDYVSLPCRQIAHPAHLPQKNQCHESFSSLHGIRILIIFSSHALRCSTRSGNASAAQMSRKAHHFHPNQPI